MNITAVVYQLEFESKHLNNELKSKIEDIRCHSTGKLSNEDTLAFYVGMSTRVNPESGHPDERHSEHINESKNRRHPTFHLPSRAMIRLLNKNKIEWTCKVLETYTDTTDTFDIAEEFHRVRAINADMPIMNAIAGMDSLTISDLSSVTDINSYRAAKKRSKELRAAKKRRDPMKLKSKIIWNSKINFTYEEKIWIAEEFKKYISHTYKYAVGHEQKYILSIFKNPHPYLFQEARLDTRFVNAQTFKKEVMHIIGAGGWYPPKVPVKDPYSMF